MHSGNHDGGHYYSFSYEFKSKIWRKFNDRNVSIELEENVMSEAIGNIHNL